METVISAWGSAIQVLPSFQLWSPGASEAVRICGLDTSYIFIFINLLLKS